MVDKKANRQIGGKRDEQDIEIDIQKYRQINNKELINRYINR